MEGMSDTLGRNGHSYLSHLLSNPSTWADKAQTDPKFTHEFIKPTLDTILSHHTGTTGVGALAGAGIGAATANKGDRKSGARKGALLGGALGLGASFVAPDASKGITEAAVDSTIRKPIGRVATNFISPVGYDSANNIHSTDKWESIKNTPKKELLNAVLKDEPIYDIPLQDMKSQEHSGDNMSVRDYMWRQSFNLPPHKNNYWVSELFKKDNDGNLHYDANNPVGKERVDSINNDSLDFIRNQLRGKSPQVPSDPMVMGHYYPKYNPQSDTVYINDPWDFDLHPDEKLDNKINWGRYLINKVIAPKTMSHTIYNAGQKLNDSPEVEEALRKIQNGS